MVARGMEELRLKTVINIRLFQMDKAFWAVDQETGVITFTSPDGLIATAPAQIVGSFNTADNAWLWAWDNPSVFPKLRQHANLTREYGKIRKIQEFTTAKFTTTEEKCWEFTALACKLGDGQGAYRGPAGDTKVFITFGAVTLQKAK